MNYNNNIISEPNLCWIIRSISCDVHQVVFWTIHRKSEVMFLQNLIDIHDLDAQSSCKVVAAPITPYYDIVLRLGNSSGGPRIKRTNESFFWHYIKRTKKGAVVRIITQAHCILSMVAHSGFK